MWLCRCPNSFSSRSGSRVATLAKPLSIKHSLIHLSLNSRFQKVTNPLHSRRTRGSEPLRLRPITSLASSATPRNQVGSKHNLCQKDPCNLSASMPSTGQTAARASSQSGTIRPSRQRRLLWVMVLLSSPVEANTWQIIDGVPPLGFLLWWWSCWSSSLPLPFWKKTLYIMARTTDGIDWIICDVLF